MISFVAPARFNFESEYSSDVLLIMIMVGFFSRTDRTTKGLSALAGNEVMMVLKRLW